MHTERSGLLGATNRHELSYSWVLSNRPIPTLQKVRVAAASFFLVGGAALVSLGVYETYHGITEHIHDASVSGGMEIIGGLFIGLIAIGTGFVDFTYRRVEPQSSSTASIHET